MDDTRGKEVARSLNKELEGHRVIPSGGKTQRSPSKSNVGGPSGSKPNIRRSIDHNARNTQCPQKNMDSRIVRSPSKSNGVSRSKDKALAVGPLKESRAHNFIPKSAPA